MIINTENFLKFTKLKLLSDDKVILNNNLNNLQIEDILQTVFIFENENSGKNIKIILKDFNTDQLICLYRYVFKYKDFLNIRNVSIVLNILNLIKTFNTFDDSFFKCEDVFIKNLEQFLDIKMELADDINELIITIFSAFNSLICSASKIEYTMLDDYEELPQFFKVFFSGIDLITLYGIFSSIDANSMVITIKKYKDSIYFLNTIIEKHKISNLLMTNLLKKLTNETDKSTN